MTTPTQQQIMDDAILSAAVYDDVRKKANQINLPVGWNIAKDLSGSDLSMSNVQGLGFAATAFKNGNNIVISYEGTDLASVGYAKRFNLHPENPIATIYVHRSASCAYGW